MKNSIIYRVSSYIWRNTILRWIRSYKSYKVEKYWKEHTVSKGSANADQTFYVIRRRDLYCGLFSLLLTNLVRIDEAIKKGYIPVIDMQNDFNIYLSEDKIGSENAWEYYFRQPCDHTLQDIGSSKHIVIGSGSVPEMFPYLDIDFLLGKTGELTYWREVAKKYIRLNDKMAEEVEQEYHRLFSTTDKVLGVKCRGTDYANGKPKNHPIQPSVEQALKKAKEIFEKQHCTKLFLATEDQKFYDAFQKEFGEKLVVYQTSYLDYQGGSMGKEEYEQENGGYQAGKEYLITTMLLSKCNCLCAGCVSGTVGALLLTEGFEYTYLFDLGIYD